MTTPALIALLLIGVVFAFQAGLAAGAPWASAAWGGTHAGTLPRRLRIAGAGSILILGFFAWIVLARDGAIDTPLFRRCDRRPDMGRNRLLRPRHDREPDLAVASRAMVGTGVPRSRRVGWSSGCQLEPGGSDPWSGGHLLKVTIGR